MIKSLQPPPLPPQQQKNHNDFYSSQIYSLLKELLRRLDYNSQEAQESANCSTSGLNQMPMEEFIPEIENEPLQTREMFSTDNDPEDVLDDEKS